MSCYLICCFLNPWLHGEVSIRSGTINLNLDSSFYLSVRSSWVFPKFYCILTPWCRVLLEKLTGLQLVKKFPAFHGTRRFITALTSVRHLSLSWASPTQSIYTHLTREKQLTYSMVQSPSSEANWFAASQEIPRISRNPKVHYRSHKRPPPVSILSQPNPVHIPTYHQRERATV